MSDVNQTIRMFQSKTDNRTTIVIYNMTQKTKEKLAELLLEDLDAVEEVDSSIKFQEQEVDPAKETSTENMTGVVAPSVEKELWSKYDNAHPEAFLATLSDTYGSISATPVEQLGKLLALVSGIADKSVKQNFIYCCRYVAVFKEMIEKLIVQKSCGSAPDYEKQCINALGACSDDEIAMIIATAQQRLTQ